MTILYTDGGCSGNQQRIIKDRNMVAVVSDAAGKILIDRQERGGSNNIAELLAVKEALEWCVANSLADVEITTDSKNNLSWVQELNIRKKIYDRNTIFALKASIDALSAS